ncbi:MAG: periplasmic heavy metal sensor [Gemmatimonadota bacterium]|nr:MAG: periplasmic heavy metal sensor [Gemmatimonadota bacterium]
MRNRWLIVVLIFSVAVNVAALVTIGIQWSRHFTRHHPLLSEPPFSERHRELLRRKLNLTEVQYQQVKEAHDKFNVEMETMHSSLRAKRKALFHQLRAPDPDRAQIDTLLVEIATLQADIERKVVDNLLSMKNVLTPEQRERFLSLIDRRFSEHRRHFGPGQRERRGPSRSKKEIFPPEDNSQER